MAQNDTIIDGIGEVRINGIRLWDSLMQLAQIGKTDKGGVCRLALSDLDGRGRDLFVHWAQEIGCQIRIDRIGNIFAHRPGRNGARPPVVAGSHLDTQPTGGKFDGNFGVLAGLEVLRTLHDVGIETESPMEVAVWTNEEGSRFLPVMMGSAVFAGAHSLEIALEEHDRDGIRVQDALASIGYAGSDEPGHPMHAYFEAHIEQGPVLERDGRTIGVVLGALGQRWYNIHVQGMEAHAGPTPMETRRDALLQASQVVQAVNGIALEHAPHGRGTVGSLVTHPNSRNVIPGRVELTVDFRHPEQSGLDAMDRSLRSACDALRRPGCVELVVQEVVSFSPCPFDSGLVDGLRRTASSLGYSHEDIVSGAAHDAVNAARVTRAAMIFVPCKGGISHTEIEDASPSDLEAGCNVLLQAMLSEAGIVTHRSQTCTADLTAELLAISRLPRVDG
jgi:N-carbamoyl-L-amino-acid hydrolase